MKKISVNIPFDIQVEIIKRLPVKSLAVFRSVSKAWKSMIDSPVFITEHTNMRQQHRLLVRYNNVVDTLEDYKFQSDFNYVSIMDNETFSQHPVRNVPELLKKKTPVLVGTSQGLFCLTGNSQEDGCYKKTAVIWNPWIGKSIAIDVPRLCKKLLTVLGFGVHPDNCDPMIVMINPVEHGYSVMLFTLSSRVWRVPRGKLPPRNSIYFTYVSLAAIDDRRCIYWKAYQKETCINLVVAFDMVSEDFTEINLPHSVAHSHDFSISKIKDSLALLEYYDAAKKGVCDVWMMVEDDVSKSFTKLFTVNTPDESLKTYKVLGFRKNDQAIMETMIGICGVFASLEVYEPRTGTIQNMRIIVERDSFFVSSYTETLLLLDQLDGNL